MKNKWIEIENKRKKMEEKEGMEKMKFVTNKNAKKKNKK